MDELVSILIPVYNREEIIAETVESALAQSYQNIEVIIVDNCSSDNTWEIVSSYAALDKRVKVFKNEINLGPIKNWIECVEKASGYYGKILWSDDLISNDYIERTIPLFDNDVGFVYTATKIFSTDKSQGRKHYSIGETGIYRAEEYIYKALYDRNAPVSPGCAIFRLSDLKKSLLLDIPNKVNSDFSTHAIGNDLLIFLLVASRYKFFGFVNEELSFFRAHSGSISVSSGGGKLPLHYALAKCYFVSNYFPGERENMASFVIYLLFLYKDSGLYKLYTVDDFFDDKVKPSKVFFMKIIFFKLFGLLIKLKRKLIY